MSKPPPSTNIPLLSPVENGNNNENGNEHAQQQQQEQQEQGSLLHSPFPLPLPLPPLQPSIAPPPPIPLPAKHQSSTTEEATPSTPRDARNSRDNAVPEPAIKEKEKSDIIACKVDGESAAITSNVNANANAKEGEVVVSSVDVSTEEAINNEGIKSLTPTKEGGGSAALRRPSLEGVVNVNDAECIGNSKSSTKAIKNKTKETNATVKTTSKEKSTTANTLSLTVKQQQSNKVRKGKVENVESSDTTEVFVLAHPPERRPTPRNVRSTHSNNNSTRQTNATTSTSDCSSSSASSSSSSSTSDGSYIELVSLPTPTPAPTPTSTSLSSSPSSSPSLSLRLSSSTSTSTSTIDDTSQSQSQSQVQKTKTNRPIPRTTSSTRTASKSQPIMIMPPSASSVELTLSSPSPSNSNSSVTFDGMRINNESTESNSNGDDISTKPSLTSLSIERQHLFHHHRSSSSSSSNKKFKSSTCKTPISASADTCITSNQSTSTKHQHHNAHMNGNGNRNGNTNGPLIYSNNPGVPSMSNNNSHSHFIKNRHPSRNPSLARYLQWHGDNTFYLNGRVMVGPGGKQLLSTLGLIIVTWLFFLTLVFPVFLKRFDRYTDDGGVYIFIFCTSALFLISSLLSSLLLTSLTDPGIIPPRLPSSLLLTMPLQILDKLSYCTTCNIIKPHRTRHCKKLNACVKVFDHHCPWTGNSVGVRNYKYFLTFGVLVIVSCSFIMAISGVVLFEAFADANADGSQRDSVYDDVKVPPPTRLQIEILIPILMVWTLIVLALLSVLLAFHGMLINRGQTTVEWLRGEFLPVPFGNSLGLSASDENNTQNSSNNNSSNNNNNSNNLQNFNRGFMVNIVRIFTSNERSHMVNMREPPGIEDEVLDVEEAERAVDLLSFCLNVNGSSVGVGNGGGMV